MGTLRGARSPWRGNSRGRILGWRTERLERMYVVDAIATAADITEYVATCRSLARQRLGKKLDVPRGGKTPGHLTRVARQDCGRKRLVWPTPWNPDREYSYARASPCSRIRGTYIREAENMRYGFGQVFPTLPSNLLARGPLRPTPNQRAGVSALVSAFGLASSAIDGNSDRAARPRLALPRRTGRRSRRRVEVYTRWPRTGFAITAASELPCVASSMHTGLPGAQVADREARCK